MYKLFVISYSGSYANSVKETVKSFGAWFNHFDNQYLVCTTMSLHQIKAQLDNKIAQGTDKLLVLEITLKDSHGWLNDNGWDWINKQKEKLRR